MLPRWTGLAGNEVSGEAMEVIPPSAPVAGDIVNLNVGGRRFSTSRPTLTWIQDSFFSSLLSGRIPSMKDETGAIFIDRDPEAFVPILNFMRTKNLDLKNVDLKTLKHEAEYYGIAPLVKRLAVCEELDKSNCGSILYYGQLSPPVFDQLPAGESVPQMPLGLKTDFSRQVLQLAGHGNFIAVAFTHCICVLGVRESRGWEIVFSTPPLERMPLRIALNTRGMAGGVGPTLAAVIGNEIKVWSCSTGGRVLTTLDMKIPVDGLFFVGTQLVAISNTGKVAVWQSVQQHWQEQELAAPICSYDMASSFLLLGCANGSIYYIDMEKFPVRLKDNDLLVTQLFEDPFKEPITALSIYMTPNVFPGSSQNWMEVAYGTKDGSVRVVVRHPENIGQAPQIFQSYHVHTCPILRVVLGEKHLISVCAENHVRTWTVTRFRGRISTQPGSTPIASFRVLSLEGPHSLFYPVNSIGPFGERDEEQVFIQRIVPETDKIFVRFCSTGQRVCEINSVDSRIITCYCVHECEAANRIGMRSRRFIFTGHINGSVQIWDLTTALDYSRKNSESGNEEGGPSQRELLEIIQHCDVSASRVSSAVSSRAPSPSPSLMSIMFPGLRAGCPATPCGTPSVAFRGPRAALFQPIVRSTSGTGLSTSNLSLNTSAIPRQSPSLPLVSSVEDERQQAPARSELRDACSQTEWEVERSELVEDNTDPTADESESVASCDASRKERERARGGSMGSMPKVYHGAIPPNENTIRATTKEPLHQRSHSNEIEYWPRSSSMVGHFRSPPGTIRGFRPVSSNSPIREGSPRKRIHAIAASSVIPNPSALSDTVSQLSGGSPRETGGGLEPGTQPLSSEDSSRPPSQVSAERISPPPWLKEFDSTLFEYFSSGDDLECVGTKSDC